VPGAAPCIHGLLDDSLVTFWLDERKALAAPAVKEGYEAAPVGGKSTSASATTVVVPPVEAPPARAATTMVASFANEIELIKGAQ